MATIRLRVLATSDVHMALRGFDYAKDRVDPGAGLDRTAALIRAARAEARNHLLFDNGDTFQGTPMGDCVAGAPGGVHPAVRVLTCLGCDAATLGNHDFNFGLPFLERVLDGARYPYVCANLRRMDGRPFLAPSAVLVRHVHDEDGDEDGAAHALRIGVIGFVPPQVTAWDWAHLEGRLTAEDIVEAGLREVPGLRARSDLVVALCHSGIGVGGRVPGAENAALALARHVRGIDVLVTGHAHGVFPGPAVAAVPGVDAARGTLAGVPAVMPGSAGSHLGVIDLVLSRDGGAWRVSDSRSQAWPICAPSGGPVAPDPAVLAETEAEHVRTVAWGARRVGTLKRRVHSFFSVVGDDPCLRLVHAGQLWFARRLPGGTTLPLLSAAAPFRAGRGGPGDYVYIAPGPLLMRHLADLYPFANTPVIVEVTGAGLREWLERAAGLFRRADPACDVPQELLDPAFPVFNFDVVSGVTYQIDVTQPARYAPGGGLADPDACRVVDLRHDGAPVDPAARFAVVTTNYRADSPAFPGMGAGATVLARGSGSSRDAILQWIESAGAVGGDLPAASWSFRPGGRALRLAFATSPAARGHLAERPALEDAGDTPGGFARLVLTVPPG